MALSLGNFTAAIPELFVLAMTCVVLLVDLFAKQKNGLLTYLLSQFALLGGLALTVLLYSLPKTVTLDGAFIHDQVGSILKALILLLSSFVFMYSRHYVRDRKMLFGEYYVLSLFCVLGMLVLVSAYNFITIYLGLELLSLPLYALVAMRRDQSVCTEAAMKYFILGAVASGMLLYGMSLIYGATGHLDITAIAHTIGQMVPQENLILLVGLVFVVVGIAFKLGAVPFHMWVPDVYQGAPSSVTLMIATAPKVAAFAMLIRLLADAMPALATDWQQLIMIISITSMALGNFVAIAQTNLKRMLAYSSIAHMGYMLLGILSATPGGFGSATFYIVTYSIMSLGAFGMIVLLSRAGIEVEEIDDLKGLNQRSPWLAFLMLLVMFSMAGIPPLVGFFAKIAVLESLVSVGLVWLAALALLFAIVGAYYYLRVVKVMYFDKAEDTQPVLIQSTDMQLAISLNGIIILLLGIFPSALFEICRAAF